MPKSTPRPTNSTANAIDSRFSDPTIIRPTAVVSERPMNRFTNTAKMIFAECSAIQRMHEHDEDGADTVDDRAVLHGRVFLVGDRNRAGQPDARAVLAGEIEIGRGLPDRVGGVLAGLQRVVVELRLELDEGAPVGIGQRLVADELAPGERRRPLVQDVLDRLRDQVEGPFGIVELDLPALDAGKPGLQRAGQAADRGIAGHDLDQGRGGLRAGR